VFVVWTTSAGRTGLGEPDALGLTAGEQDDLAERRVLVNELVDHVAVYPDHLEVAVHGVPKLNVLLAEVGLVEQSGFSRVGRPMVPLRTPTGLRKTLPLT
jgi:hypothetical protein